MRDISKNIKQLRTQKGITQDELAEALFVTRQTVSNYETGKSRPDVDMLVNIAAALETDVNTLIYSTSADNERSKKVKNAIILLIVLAALIIAETILTVETRDWLRSHYKYAIYFTCLLVINPLLALVSGWCVMYGLGVLLKFKPVTGKFTRCVRIVLLVISAVLLLVTVSIWTGVPLSGRALAVLIHTRAFIIKNPVIFAVLTAALWVFGFPKKKSE